MYLQLACNVAAVGDDGMDRQIQFVGNRLVGHAFYDAGNDFLFTLAERFLFAVFLIFFFGMEKTVDFCGESFRYRHRWRCFRHTLSARYCR